MYYSELEIETRESLINNITRKLSMELTQVNSAFRFCRIETPILTDNKLRGSTIPESYVVARLILNGSLIGRQRLPIVIWQHGKIFTQTSEEIYTLEYHVLFSNTTGKDYRPLILQTCKAVLIKHCGPIVQVSISPPQGFLSHDELRLQQGNEQLALIRERTDFWAGRNIEIVFNMDACTTAYLQHPASVAE
jgi:hypothetical protein